MKVFFLNLPNRFQVIRRYMCSYNAPNFLFPPLELMYLAAIVKKQKGAEVEILDAIAERMNLSKLEKVVYEAKPDLIVFISGFEIFQEDMEAAIKLKAIFPAIKFIALGFYPTIFADQILLKTNIDLCIMGEPEETFSEFYDNFSRDLSLDNIKGIAFKIDGHLKINGLRNRIEDLDSLPFPARDLVNNNLYGEPLMGRPFTLIQSARGCPFNCTYCVKSFGKKFVSRSAGNIIAEIEECVGVYGIRNFRFIDDTFNIDRRRVDEICNMILDKRLNVEWTALSRIDTVEPESLRLMRRAGCRRLYIGIESGSQKILDLYKKKYNVDRIKKSIAMIHDAGIESVGFFMVGVPGEKRQDFQKTLKLSMTLDLDYASMFKTRLYPGTPLFDMYRNELSFSLFPYENCLKDERLEKIYGRWVKIFHLRYYLRATYIINRLFKFLKKPKESLKGLFYLLRYLIVPASKKPRDDFL